MTKRSWEPEGQDPHNKNSLSILLPVLNEVQLLPGFLLHLQRRITELAAVGCACELIIIDGGSSDGSQDLLERLQVQQQLAGSACAFRYVQMVQIGGGRARQLNAGLALARGTTVLCCAVDLRLSRRALPAIVAAIRGGASHGCLYQRSAGHAAQRAQLFQLQDYIARLRARCCCSAYLDQAPFYNRQQMLRSGGFHAVGAYDSADLARRIGHPQSFQVVKAIVLSSSRGWSAGFFRQVLRHQSHRAAYLLGIKG